MTRFGRPAATRGALAGLRWLTTATVLGLSVLAFAPSAAAATGDSVTVNHSSDLSVRTNRQLTVESTARPTCTLGLTQRTVTVTLTGPSGSHSATSTLASSKQSCNKTVHLDPQFATPARNGTYAVALRNGGASSTTSASLEVRVPPSQPKNFAVAADGTEATFAWSANPEPDVTAYFITTPSGQLIKPVRADVACNTSSTCATRDNLGPSVAGHTESFVIHAIRCGITCEQHIAGPDSAEATAHFTPQAPLPTAPPAPAGGGTGPARTPPPTVSASSSAVSSASTQPAAPSQSASSSSPTGGRSSASSASTSSTPPPVGASSSPPGSTGASPSPTAVAAASGSSHNSGGDWAVRAVAIVLVLITLALFVRALSNRTAAA